MSRQAVRLSRPWRRKRGTDPEGDFAGSVLAPHLAVRLQQALVDRAALEVVAQRRQPEEALVLVEQRERLFQCLAAVHQRQRRLVGTGVGEPDEVGDAAVNLLPRVAALAVLGDPGAAFV